MVGDRRAERAQQVGDLRVGDIGEKHGGVLGRQAPDLVDERGNGSGGVG